jgi:hypothetical protein
MSAADQAALQKQGAAELVLRARNFDQNAMAMLKEVADNAAKGDPVAASALEHVKAYIAAHPAEESGEIDAPHLGRTESLPGSGSARSLGILKDPRNAPETLVKALAEIPRVGVREDVTTACSILAVGPTLTDEVLSALFEAAGPWKSTVAYGFENAGDEARLAEANRSVTPHGGAGYLCAGHCLGMARRIQEAARGHVAAIGAEVAWEMGCG